MTTSELMEETSPSLLTPRSSLLHASFPRTPVRQGCHRLGMPLGAGGTQKKKLGEGAVVQAHALGNLTLSLGRLRGDWRMGTRGADF